MKTPNAVLPWTRARLLILCGLVIAMGSPLLFAAPPKKKPQERVPEGLEKVGDFLFRLARKLEQGFPRELPPVVIYESEPRSVPRAYPSTGLELPPGYREEPYYVQDPAPPGVSVRIETLRPPPRPRVEEPYAPNYQPDLRAGVTYPRPPVPEGRSRLSVPVPASPDASVPMQRVPAPAAPRTGSPFDPPPTPQDKPDAEQTRPTDPAPLPTAPPKAKTQSEPEFATPVPGKPGFVYPPGAPHDSKSLLDVRDFAAGQKVKDPRTGQMFLVPPK